MAKLLEDKQKLYQNYIMNRIDAPELAKLYGVGLNTVRRALYAFGIEKSQRFPNVFTDEQKSLVYGTLLGDGNLSIQKNGTNACLRIEHGQSQIDYLRYKFAILKPWLNSNDVTLQNEKTSGFNSKFYKSAKLTTVAHPLFTEMYHKFYNNGVKVVTPEILENIDKLALAFWHCDDGSYFRHKGNRSSYMKLATCNFTETEQRMILDWFQKRWNIHCTLQSVGRKLTSLLFSANEARKLASLITPYVPECMKYKIELASVIVSET